MAEPYDLEGIARFCVDEAAECLHRAFSKSLPTRNDLVERDHEIQQAHRLLECAAMLRAANKLTFGPA